MAVAWLIPRHDGWLVGGRTRRALFSAGVATILALLIAVVIGHIWDRPRPFVVLRHYHKLIPHPADASFPSDHVSGSFAIVFTLMLYRRWRLATVALIAGVLIGLARVMVGVHWPTDVLGGVGVGALAALLVAGPLSQRVTGVLGDWCSQLYGRVLFAVLGLARRRGVQSPGWQPGDRDQVVGESARRAP